MDIVIGVQDTGKKKRRFYHQGLIVPPCAVFQGSAEAFLSQTAFGRILFEEVEGKTTQQVAPLFLIIPLTTFGRGSLDGLPTKLKYTLQIVVTVGYIHTSKNHVITFGCTCRRR